MHNDNFYRSGRGNLNKLTLPENQDTDSYSIKSPTGKDDIVFKLVKLDSTQISKVVKKSKFNRRSVKNLSASSILDIYPSIEKANSNSKPVMAYGTMESMVLIEGMRRAYAVSLLEKGELLVFLASTIHPDDEKVLVKDADQYLKPTTVDIALSLSELEKVENKSFSVRDIAEHFLVSVGTAQNAKKISETPKEVFELFPGLQYIEIRFLVKLLKNDESKIKEACTKTSSYHEYLNKFEKPYTEENYNSISRDIQKGLLEYLKPKSEKEVTLSSIWTESKFKQGVKLEPKQNGSIAITISPDLENELAEKLIDILKE